jgi:hypothetical protein
MKICIFGIGKSGTTALLFKVAGGLPKCQAFSGGKPGEHVADYENAVYKYTYSERKGKTFDRFREHFEQERYDRHIWIARDPRDAAVSAMLYRWHKGYKEREDQYRAHLDLVRQKEKDPRSVSFAEICRFAGHGAFPVSVEQIVEEERTRYGRMADFVRLLGGDWFLFKYEDMVDGRFDALNRYLGFAVREEEEVGTAYRKVVRRKQYGDWRHWFTAEDVRLYKPAYSPYMEAVGYDVDDWALSPDPVIEPRYASEYMQSLPGQAPRHKLLRFVDEVVRPAFARVGASLRRALRGSGA